MTEEIPWLFLWIFILIFLALIGSVSILRQIKMRFLAKKLGLSYKYREFKKSEKISNILFGSYKGKNIKIYDSQRILRYNDSLNTRFNSPKENFFDALYLVILIALYFMKVYKVKEKPIKRTIIEINNKKDDYVFLDGLLYLPSSEILKKIDIG